MKPSSSTLTAVLTFIISSCVVVLFWMYRAELLPAREVGALVQITTAADSYGTETVLLADRSGHYFLNATANNTRIEFLIDTGASTTILSYDDARRVGVNVRRLTFDVPVMTGAGQVAFARTRLSYIEYGQLRVDGIEALVAAEDAMPQSVLGINFLSRLRSYSVESGKMTLVP